ncbi:MAG: subclass B1 metallo-beta-lactamase [Chitinophagaceae bacterium]
MRLLLFVLILMNCIGISGQPKKTFVEKTVYKTADLVIVKVAENSFQHISFKQTNDFGKVPCNGLIVKNKQEVVVFDTPINDAVANKLINWIKTKLNCRIKAVIPTHFHDDCLGGLTAFQKAQIPSFANTQTIALAKEHNEAVPENAFTDSLLLLVGNEKILVKYFGGGHTKDNVVGYFAKDKILFGGCLIKELGANKGYLGDAVLSQWSKTVTNIKAYFPYVQKVVPGHGKAGDAALLDYTIQLFKQE